MEYGLLGVIACVVAGGVGGGLLAAWSCARRLLALEQHVATLQTAYDDRFNLLSKIVTRQDKTEAAKVRWSKKGADEEALASKLANGAQPVPFAFPAGW